MFRTVGLRLAILNAIVVVIILAIVGLANFLVVDHRLSSGADQYLNDRADSAVLLWNDEFGATASATANVGEKYAVVETVPPDPNRDDDDRGGSDHELDDHEDLEVEELLRSGDTIAFGFDSAGQLVVDSRGIPVDGLPRLDAIDRALSGLKTIETVEIDNEAVRVLTKPVYVDGSVAGAVQVAQGQQENQATLQAVRLSTLAALVLGALIAIPAGLFLANRSLRPIRASFDRQRAFVADASHELRTPLTLLRAQAEYFQRTPDLSDEERRTGDATIVEEVDAMSELVDELLLLARADDGSLKIERVPTDLADIVRKTVARFERQALEKDVGLRADSLTAVIASVDPGRLAQTISILVDNAITYTPSGGSVVIETRQQSDRALVVVSDSGIGIDSSDISRIFDRFYRSDRARSREVGGFGLGLAIAKMLVEAQGGELTVRSESGVGSEFVISMPMAERTRTRND